MSKTPTDPSCPDNPQEKPVKTIMVRIDGKSFRCTECGSNCFHHPDERDDRYECNGCGTWYIGTS